MPEILACQDTAEIVSGSGEYDFGQILVRDSNKDITFTIENLSIVNLILSGTPKIQIFGTDAEMFTINQTSTTSPIVPSANTIFTITFSPTSAGSKSATISIPNTDFDENPYTFGLFG